MAKIGRNDPCPCGSGKKYKQCCLASDQNAAAARAAAQAAAAAEQRAAERAHRAAGLFDDEDELTTASNAVVDLVHAGELDRAEAAARDLLERFPDVHDGYDRLGMVYEARGEPRTAADYYRKALAVIRQHPDDYDPQLVTMFRDMIKSLDPPPAP